MDTKYMCLALKEANKAYEKEEVPVGAIIVKDGIIISKAHNLREKKNLSTAHAELLAIEKACKKLDSWRLDGCELYVTLEPCLMCAGAIIQSRIKTVYFGAIDEKNGAIVTKAHAFDLSTTHKVQYEQGVLQQECSDILKIFFKELRVSKEMKKSK